ncbi:MAG: hypothetical protein ETSY1_33225 [Candidatus Entotheonella factor]|uniref:Uncharacterized protein n=1 Tax=Entotheonella factor TaxID=1429438 RepID=W4LAA0_ENTF1|nr:MAG: hypothetical protein ETSY1_33225 [Candidatus Entotheonella factor]
MVSEVEESIDSMALPYLQTIRNCKKTFRTSGGMYSIFQGIIDARAHLQFSIFADLEPG